jgi:peptidoglycan/LPS O-acetylase OafA/YrhL
MTEPALTTTSGHLPSQRLYALDNLRALAMWLGIVLHVSAIHWVNPSPLPWRDEQRTIVADLLGAFIHSFRMPVFFILAGYFAAMLLQQRGAGGMLKNRVKRLGLPFALFWLPIFSACVVLALLFVHRMARGTWGLDAALLQRQAPNVPQGPSTMHMWFLWMLLWLCVLTAALHRFGGAPLRRFGSALAAALGFIGAGWWGFMVLALPLAVTGAFYPNGIVTPNGSFLPPLAEWVHNGLFFAFGLSVYGCREHLLPLFTRRAWAYAAAGLPLFFGTLVLMEMLRQPDRPIAHLPFWIALAYNCATWLWSFAMVGLALRYMPRRNAVLGYLADSSYWVYLVHMPATIGFGALLFGVPIPALAKMGINIAATTLVCLATYHLFVRFTPVSTLLNGKRHPRKIQGVLAHANP